MSGNSVHRLNLSYKTLALCAVFAFLSALPLHAHDDWRYEETRTDSRDFPAGGFLHVRMGVGELQIRKGDTNKISLRYTVKSRQEKNVKEAHVDFDVKGTDANIDFHAPMSHNTEFEVELTVPANTNLDVHEKVGDMTIEQVEGDKDLQLSVGDIRVSDEHAGYRLVQASAGIGDVSSGSYGETSGWLGKSLKYHGEGKYALRAHVGVGDITLR